jgi:hypothetical protein
MSVRISVMNTVVNLLGLGCEAVFYPEAVQGQERTLPIQILHFKHFKSKGSSF